MSTTVHSEKVSSYEAITAQIVAAIEAGVARFQMPWHSGLVPMTMPMNACTDVPYRGVNVVALWAQAATRLYPSGYWASYKQWQTLGAQVRKDERGSAIVFYKKLDGEDDEASEAEAPRIVLRHSHVFNVCQVDGWELPEAARKPSQVVPHEQIAAFVAATKAKIQHGGLRAFYHRIEDYIAMPAPEYFTGSPTRSATEAYHAVQLHELTHWTGAPHRLDRMAGKRFGDREYAFEELVAELGAAFLCSAFRLVNEPRPDHAAYIEHWLGILKKDNRAIFAAARLAQEAVEYLQLIAAEGA